MRQCHFRIPLSHLFDRVAPELADIQDVRLVHGADTPVAFHRDLESHFGDADDLGFGIDHRVEPLDAVVAARLAEIDASDQLAYDHQIDPLDDGRLEGRRVDQFVIDGHGPKVREDLQLLSKLQEPCFRPFFTGKIVPFLAADRAKEDRIRALDPLERLFGGGIARRVDRGPAEKILFVFELEPLRETDRIENLHRLFDDLRSDPVSLDQRNFVASHQARSFLSISALA